MRSSRSVTRLLLLAAITLTLFGIRAEARGARPHRAPKQVKEQIMDLEQQWRMASLNSDVSTVDRLLSEDYVGISWTGQVNTKATQLDRLRTHSLQLTRLDLSDAKVKLVGSVAIVTSLAEIEGTNDGMPMQGMFRYTRVYQRLPGGTWKITNFEATRLAKHARDSQNALP